MTIVKLTSVAVLALALGACQSLFTPNYRTPLEVKRDAWEHVKPGCSESDCPLVNIDMVHFPALPMLIVFGQLQQALFDDAVKLGQGRRQSAWHRAGHPAGL